MIARNESFRNFNEFFSAGATDGAFKIGRKFFTFKGEDTIVASVFLHSNRSLIFILGIGCIDRSWSDGSF